ncbi:hypothetical protein AHAS_Ahas16G0153700 [Arachis hypogaea]
MIADANAQIQKLNISVAVLQDKQTSLENEVKILKEAIAASDLRGKNLKKQVSKLIRKIEELEILVKKVEQATVDGVFDAVQNILDQIKLRAPNLDVSKVDAFKKVVDGKVVSIV